MKGGSLFCSKVPRLRTPSPTSPHHHYRRWPTTSDHGGGHGRQWWRVRRYGRRGGWRGAEAYEGLGRGWSGAP
ncbi:hypothetical protein ES332_D01G075600v1 [Gossypium tomentosum]|uniref:Uncharacterized protein n=1 Tax=Gossypium tomentosum TaxID=34277 RepID=A0A5D2M6H1_GOSTO|nr:hypothetical protein ES332_D01G075600v1 [Gossypium tomentosum]